MSKTEKPDPAIIKRYRREVPVDLTPSEVEAYGRKLAAKKRERDDLTEKAKKVAATYKGDIATVSAEVDRLATAINAGSELRSTEVYDKLEGSQVKTYLAATHALIDQRPAGFADEQVPMFPEPGDEDEEEEEKPVADFAEPAKPAKAKKPRKKKTVN